MSTDFDALTERQQIALAFVERKRLHQVRRDALRAYADTALRDADIAAAVRNVLKYQRENGVNRPVTKLRSVK